MSPTLSDDELNALLDQFPALSGRRRRLENLPGGLTNRNVKVTTDEGTYVARCADPDNLLGIDRAAEVYNSRAAERAGVGAPVIDYRPELGILLFGFLVGVTLRNEDFRRPGVIAKVAAGCRALHAGPRFCCASCDTHTLDHSLSLMSIPYAAADALTRRQRPPGTF